MAKIIGNSPCPIGTAIFSVNAGKFEVRIGNRNFFVQDEQIKQKKGKYFVDVGKLYLPGELKELEIPKLVIERKDAVMEEISRSKGTIGETPSAEGKVYFSVDSKGRLVAKRGELEVTAENIEFVYGKYVIRADALELGHPYLIVPADVLTRYKNISRNRPVKINFTPQGSNPLDGKTYYKLATELPENLFSKVMADFEYFGTDGELKGWLTAFPEIVSKNLGFEFTA